MTLHCGQPGCHAADEADVCYHPYRVLGDRNTTIRVGANANAAAVLTVGPYNPMGVQSVLQTATSGCTTHLPGRGGRDGWVWVYNGGPGASKGGWVPAGDLYPDGGVNVCGPDGHDTRCGPNNCPQGPCDGSVYSQSGFSGVYTVISSEVYLRYSPQGTAFEYLVNGDMIEIYCRALASNGTPYYCGKVIKSKWCPLDTRGWVITSAF